MLHMRLRTGIGILLLVLLGLAGCATGDPDAPDWVVDPPEGSEEYAWFSASGHNPAGDLTAAEDEASQALIAGIMAAIGVRDSDDANVIARDALATYTRGLAARINGDGDAPVTGFEVVDRSVSRRDGEVTVYLLGRYEREELSKDRQRFRELFQEGEDAIDIPERRGSELYEQGRYGEALPYLLRASAAAAVSDQELADIRFDRNMQRAREIVESLALEPLTEVVQAVVREPVAEPLRVQAFYQQDGEQVPLAEVPLRVAYREVIDGRRSAIRTADVVTGPQGIAGFQHPAPSYVGRERVAFSLNLAEEMAPLLQLGGRYRSLVRSLEDAVLQARTTVEIVSEGRARNMPTAVFVLDLDIAGNPIRDQATAEGLRESLEAEGFTIRELDLSPSILLDMTEEEFLGAVRAGYGDEIERLVYGVAEIMEFREDDDFIVSVSGDVQTIELHTGDVLHRSSSSSRARGRSSSRAIFSAFRNLGAGTAEDLIRSLE